MKSSKVSYHHKLCTDPGKLPSFSDIVGLELSVSNLNQDEYLDDDYYKFIIQLTKFVCLTIK
jgi:hypothetical protein